MTVATTFPVSFIGVVAPSARADLHFSGAVVGLIAATYWAASATVALTAGAFVRRTPPRALMALCVGLAALALLGDAAISPSWQWLVVWAAVGGAANALGHPSSNTLLVRDVPLRLRALAFGVKQAAIPIASVLTGAALPLVVVRFGWRSAFVPAVVLCVLSCVWILCLPRDASRASRPVPGRVSRDRGGVPRASLPFLLAVAATTMVASFQSNAMTAFLVSGARHVRIDASTAGLLLVVASLSAAGTRALAGGVAGRWHGKALVTVAVLLGVGALGLTAMASGTRAGFLVGAVVAFVGAYGWPGLIHFVVADAMGEATPGATLLTQSGSYVGSTFGPITFGLLFDASPGVMWFVMAGCAAAASVIALVAHGRYRTWTAVQTPVPSPADH